LDRETEIRFTACFVEAILAARTARCIFEKSTTTPESEGGDRGVRVNRFIGNAAVGRILLAVPLAIDEAFRAS